MKMKDIFLQDQKNSRQITGKQWKKRPLKQKIIESVVRLLAPLL